MADERQRGSHEIVQSRENTVTQLVRAHPMGCAVEKAHAGNPWHFSSERIDEEVDLVYYGLRCYDSDIGLPSPHQSLSQVQQLLNGMIKVQKS